MRRQRARRYRYDGFILCCLLVCLSLVGWYGVRLVRTLTVASHVRSWQETPAEILHFRMRRLVRNYRMERTLVQYTPDVSYRYRAADTIHTGTSFMVTNRTFRHEDEAWAYAAETAGVAGPCRYPGCPPVQVFYDPARPEHAVMLRDVPWLRIIGWHGVLIVGFGFGAIGCLRVIRTPSDRRPGNRHRA